MVKTLFELGFPQSIISSNFRRNFEPSLEKAEINPLFLHKIGRVELMAYKGDKGTCMQDYSDRLQLSFSDFVYVGDAEADYQAACRAEVRFVGSGYGWQISPDDTRFPSAKSPLELQEILMNL
jgi:phosphoglycolate phosphatase-like HAD superfamily hydrolase